MKTKKEIRYAFSKLGIKVSIVKHYLIENGLTLKSKDFPFQSNCFSGEFLEKNKEVFVLWNSLRGTILDSGEKLI